VAGLSAGNRVGPYEILASLGAGGMGEVWKARDTRLDRIVALKFSRAQFSERFEREARAIAALNHPNIAQIYDVGENYLVMEFVEGAPLQTPEDIRQLLDMALQIADGLSAAHAAGIVHRDLKPDNMLITKERRVKILDFGLAKQQVAADADATRAITITDPGTVVGTVAYMSPEQARGRELDYRSDQFSFGLILYELAAGKRAFRRDSAAETMTAIIRDEAEPLPPTVPAPVRWTIERCLAKDPDQRYDSTRDLYRELRQTRDGLSQTLGPPAAVVAAAPRAGWRWPWAAAVATAIAAGALLGACLQSLRHTATPSWAGVRLGGPVVALAPRVSPDGQMLALLTLVNRQTQVAIMKPDGGSWNVLTHDTTNGSATNVSWARDGSRLFFDRFWERPAGVYSIPPLGGEPTLLLEDGWAPQPLPDGSLVVLKRTPRGHDEAFRFWPDTGRSEPLPAYLERSDGGPPLRAFADGKEVIFIGATEEAGIESGTQPYILDLATRKSRRLDPQAPIDKLDFQLGIPLAPTPDGHGVLMLGRKQNSFELIRVERNGKPGHTRVLSFANGLPPFYADVTPDGSIYVDSAEMSPSISRFTVGGRLIAESAAPPPSDNRVLLLNDGRVLLTAPLGGNLRLLCGMPGTDFRPFLQGDAVEAAYASPVSADEVALLLGPPGKRRIGFASVRNGVLRRELPVPGGNATMVAVSSSLKTIYYVAQGTVYSMPDAGGPPARLTEGEDLAIDPAGRLLVIHSSQGMVRLQLPSAAAEPIVLPAGMRLASVNLSPSAIDRKGRILLGVVTPQDFDYKPAIVDGRTVTVIAADRPGDNLVPGWTPEGDVIAVHDLLRSELWRFSQAAK
jgi:predicted Ser/Thr protein kinase